MNPYRLNRLTEIAQSLVPKRTGRAFHVSFILNKNKLLVTAINDYTKEHLSHKFGEYTPYRASLNYKPGRHSEINALSLFLKKFGSLDVSGLTLLNIRIGFDGATMNAKPCKNCEKVLASLDFKSILWT